MLEGDVLSAHARGEYRLEDDLDFTVQVQMLRAGAVAQLLRTATFPLTKLLAFYIGGTLDRPNWRPENLPKELFLKFN